MERRLFPIEERELIADATVNRDASTVNFILKRELVFMRVLVKMINDKNLFLSETGHTCPFNLVKPKLKMEMISAGRQNFQTLNNIFRHVDVYKISCGV